jgi:hypothetical protein
LINELRQAIPTDTSLRESLKAYGWVKEFPALADERGTILVGNRRMALAKELSIKPVIQTIQVGDGDEADVERVKLAIVSNTGGVSLTRDDRTGVKSRRSRKPQRSLHSHISETRPNTPA